MTIEQLRLYPDCAGYSDEQLQEIVTSMETLALILVDIWNDVCDEQTYKQVAVNPEHTPSNKAA